MPAIVESMIGPDTGDLTWWQMSLRALVVFLAGLAIVRLGSARFLGQSTALDFLVVVIIGSVLSKAINGHAPLLTTLVATLTLVCAHWFFAWLTFRSHRVGVLVKGSEHILVRDGKIDWKEMARCHLSERDLLAALRLQAGSEDIEAIGTAQLERTGEISVVKKG